MAQNIIIGLDVGTSAVKIMAAENRKGELHVLAAVQKPSAGLRRGYILDPEAAGAAVKTAIKEIERISSIKVKHGFVAAGGIKLETIRARGSMIVSRADNEVSEADIKRAVSQAEGNLSRLSNRTVIHRLPLAYRIDGENVFGKPVGLMGEKLETEVLFLACQSQHLENLIKSADLADINIDDITAGPLAASYAFLSKRQKEVGVVLVDIGAETTSIAVFEEGNLLSLEVFSFGSSHITNDIALGLQIPLEEAEELKFNYVSNNQKKKLTDIIEARLKDIFELIENHLKKINRSGLLPAGAVLIGGGANLSDMEIFTKTSLKLPVKLGTPINLLKIHDKQFYNPKWATALGLCVLGSDETLNPDKETGLNIKKGAPSFLRWLKSFLP